MGKIVAVNDFSGIGYPSEMDYNNLQPYNSIMGVLVAVTDEDFNVLDNFIGDREDKEEVLNMLIACKDKLAIIDAMQIRNGELMKVNFLYIPYKNTLCTKYMDTFTAHEIYRHDDEEDSNSYNDIKLEVALSYAGLERYVPLRFKSINIGIMSFIKDTLDQLDTIIKTIVNGGELSNQENDLADVFGIYNMKNNDSEDLHAIIEMFNKAGEKIVVDISSANDIELMITSIRILGIDIKTEPQTKEEK
jgi:hypothetical protein